MVFNNIIAFRSEESSVIFQNDLLGSQGHHTSQKWQPGSQNLMGVLQDGFKELCSVHPTPAVVCIWKQFQPEATITCAHSNQLAHNRPQILTTSAYVNTQPNYSTLPVFLIGDLFSPLLAGTINIDSLVVEQGRFSDFWSKSEH